MHDWAYVLGPDGLGALDRAGAIAALVSGAGLLAVVTAVVGCLATPALAPRPTPRSDPEWAAHDH